MPTHFDDDPFDPLDPVDPFGATGDDARLGDALRRTAETLPPADTRGLVHDGLARGRTLRRRRVAAVTAGVAVFALAGAGGVLAGGVGTSGGGKSSTGVAAAPSHSRTATPAGPPALSGKQVAHLFVSMLPAGTVTGVRSRGTATGIPYAYAVLDDGHGPGALSFGIDLDGAAPTCPGTDAPGTSCTSSRLPGGTLTILKGYEYPDHRAQAKDWDAYFVNAAGAVVDLSEWNAAAEKGAPVSRPNPPLSSARLAAIVTDSRWHRVIDAIPADPKPGESARATTGPGAAVDPAKGVQAGTQ
jgi:hypothetical protein